jgi:hypothetical protein
MGFPKRRIVAIVDARLLAITEVRIAAVAATAANLRTQLDELNQLRAQIKVSRFTLRATNEVTHGAVVPPRAQEMLMAENKMDDFIETENIARFKTILKTEADPDRRTTVTRLLADEEAKRAARIEAARRN